MRPYKTHLNTSAKQPMQRLNDKGRRRFWVEVLALFIEQGG